MNCVHFKILDLFNNNVTYLNDMRTIRLKYKWVVNRMASLKVGGDSSNLILVWGKNLISLLIFITYFRAHSNIIIFDPIDNRFWRLSLPIGGAIKTTP